MVEIVVKIIFDPKSFRKVLEILDGLVITISFSLNIFLLINNIQVHAISGLITLLRYLLKNSNCNSLFIIQINLNIKDYGE